MQHHLTQADGLTPWKSTIQMFKAIYKKIGSKNPLKNGFLNFLKSGFSNSGDSQRNELTYVPFHFLSPLHLTHSFYHPLCGLLPAELLLFQILFFYQSSNQNQMFFRQEKKGTKLRGRAGLQQEKKQHQNQNNKIQLVHILYRFSVKHNVQLFNRIIIIEGLQGQFREETSRNGSSLVHVYHNRLNILLPVGALRFLICLRRQVAQVCRS